MNRRGFLGAILATGMAPAVVRAESLMKLVARPSGVLVLTGWQDFRPLGEGGIYIERYKFFTDFSSLNFVARDWRSFQLWRADEMLVNIDMDRKDGERIRVEIDGNPGRLSVQRN